MKQKLLVKKLNEYTLRELIELKGWGLSEIDEWDKFIGKILEELERRKENL